MFWTCCFYIAIAMISLYTLHSLKSNHPKRVHPSEPSYKEKNTPAQPAKATTIESFILNELQNSVKELKSARTPFKSLDINAVQNLNPNVSEFLPKARLNPLAEDFRPV